MSSEKTEAVVIRLADFSESSRVVTLFSRDWGKVSAVAKGARRLKGPFEAALDLLAVCRIVFIRKSSSSLDILTEAQLISRFRPQGRNLNRFYGGYYLAELLSSLTEDYDPHLVLYDEAVQTLSRLAADEDPKLALLRFELVVLREIGQLPAFDLCVVCGQETSQGGPFGFWVSQGGLICPKCQKQEYQHHRIPAGTVTILRRLAAKSDSASKNLAVSAEQFHEMRHVTTAAISHALGRRPKTLRYLSDR